jgi:hypothetical protein
MELFWKWTWKGLHDGVGVVIKRFLRREQLDAHGAKLQNIEEMADFLCKNLLDILEASYVGVKRPL